MGESRYETLSLTLTLSRSTEREREPNLKSACFYAGKLIRRRYSL